jgi:hypothetical protein
MKKLRITWMVMVLFISTAITVFACDVNPYSIAHAASDNTLAAEKADNVTIGCDVNPYSIAHDRLRFAAQRYEE